MSNPAIPLQNPSLQKKPAVSNGAGNDAARYLQATRTYFRPIPLAIVLVVLIVSLIPVYLTRGFLQLAFMSEVCMAVAVIGMVITVQLRRQLDDARASLTPGFRAPHFFAAAFTLGLLNFLPPIALHYLVNETRIASYSTYPTLAAYTFLLTATVAWIFYEPFGVIVLLVLAANLVPHNLVLLYGLPNEYVIPIPYLWPLCILLSFSALILLFAIYSRFNGEAPSQNTSQSVNVRFRAHSAESRIPFRVGPVTTLLIRLLTVLQTVLEKLRAFGLSHNPAPTAAPTFLQRVRLRRRATFLGFSPALVGALITLIIVLFYAFSDSDSGPTDGSDAALIFFLVPIGIFIPVIGTLWPRHWLFLPAESLLPATRTQFVRELAAAIAADLLSFWLAVSITAAVALLLIAPHNFPLNAQRIVACMLFTASALTFAAGLYTWSILFRNAIVSTLAVPIAIAGMICAASYLREHPLLPPLLLLLGLTLAARAYHRWQRIDLA